MKRRALAIVLIMLAGLLGLGWALGRPHTRAIRMATTTSTEASGLLDVLLPAFENRTGIGVHAIAVGSGKALKLAEQGDVDLVMVHAPGLEKEFVKRGSGVKRTPVFFNDFIIAGPRRDPAGIRGKKKATEAFRRIAEKRNKFISRGDNSGTHRKEMEIWKRAGIYPADSWYIETGQGMGATLKVADEKQAYCLVDRGTFLAFEGKIQLGLLCEGEPLLKNPYAVIAVNPERRPYVKYKEAKIFIDWMLSDEARALVNGFTRGGKRLFYTFY